MLRDCKISFLLTESLRLIGRVLLCRTPTDSTGRLGLRTVQGVRLSTHLNTTFSDTLIRRTNNPLLYLWDVTLNSRGPVRRPRTVLVLPNIFEENRNPRLPSPRRPFRRRKRRRSRGESPVEGCLFGKTVRIDFIP